MMSLWVMSLWAMNLCIGIFNVSLSLISCVALVVFHEGEFAHDVWDCLYVMPSQKSEKKLKAWWASV